MINSDNKITQNNQLLVLQKLDYFILGADIALLGWTVVNADWVPKCNIWIIAIFWALIILSIIFGVVRQICIAEFLRFDDLCADCDKNDEKKHINNKIDFIEKMSMRCGYASIIFLAVALILLAIVRTYTLY